MRWGFSASWVFVLLLSPGAVLGQYQDYTAAQEGWSLPGARPSIRLAGMAGLVLAVADENNEINLSDFGGNLAGVAEDRSGWTLETWLGRSNNTDDWNTAFRGLPVRQRSRFNIQTGGADVVYRKEGRRAIGWTGLWNGYDLRQRYGDRSRVRGPEQVGFYNEVFGSLSLAIGYTRFSDNEDVVSDDIFSIRHTTAAETYSLAAAYALYGLRWGTQVDIDRVRIDGVSADPAGFHRDEFEWQRPATRWKLQVIRPEGEGRVAFGASLGRVRREGTEEARINWSDRFPANPGGINFTTEIPSFEEEENGWQVDGRAAYAFSSSIRLGALGSYRSCECKVVEAPNSNFVGSRRSEESSSNQWRLGGGGGLALWGQRLRLGAEGFVGGGHREVSLPRVQESSDQRGYELRLGGEYFLPSRLAFRGGYQRDSYDSDVDRPESLSLGDGVTLGVGYAPLGGTVSMDVAVRVWRRESAEPGSVDRKEEAEDLGVSFRVLF